MGLPAPPPPKKSEKGRKGRRDRGWKWRWCTNPVSGGEHIRQMNGECLRCLPRLREKRCKETSSPTVLPELFPPPHSFCARAEAAASLEGEVSFLCLVLVTLVLFGWGAQTSKKKDPKPDLWPQPPPAKRLSLPFSFSFFSGFVHR